MFFSNNISIFNSILLLFSIIAFAILIINTLHLQLADVIECDQNAKICGDALCENTVGSYKCNCDAGYEHNSVTNKCEGAYTCSVNAYMHVHTEGRKEGNVLLNDALNTFYLRLYGVRHMVKDHSDSEKGNPLPPHRLLFLISSTIPQTG